MIGAVHFGREDFIRSYLERAVPMFAPRLPAETVGRLWRMLAHLQGGLLNQAQLAASLGVSASAIGRYVDLLVDLRLLRRLLPWSGNVGKRRCMRCWNYRVWRHCWATRWWARAGREWCWSS